jgi:histidyl-tRNA synthetase
VLVPLIQRGVVTADRSVPSAVLVSVADEESRGAADDVATALRARGIPCEVAPAAAKFGKQIRHADRRGIPYVWFTTEAVGATTHEVKDIRSGNQVPADPSSWEPPAEDLRPAIISAVIATTEETNQ